MCSGCSGDYEGADVIAGTEEATDMTPFELAYQLKQIVASKCACETMWRDAAVTREEAEEIRTAVEEFLEANFQVTA